MHSRSSELDFDLVSYFEPYVQQWLVNTDNKTAQWVTGVSGGILVVFNRSADAFFSSGHLRRSSGFTVFNAFSSFSLPIYI